MLCVCVCVCVSFITRYNNVEEVYSFIMLQQLDTTFIRLIYCQWLILMPAVASLKICTLMYYFCRKYIIFEPKNYSGIMCHDTEEWYKMWGVTDLYFEKWHKEFGKF